eukprot:768074-Hanusia_phi.AAC.1
MLPIASLRSSACSRDMRRLRALEELPPFVLLLLWEDMRSREAAGDDEMQEVRGRREVEKAPETPT